ncbi:MAG: hypothetical protein Q8O84_05230 [Nanoarchaeota archaeon]|nr:hypothetical protein [Nanoarchaeota archaeon]
MKKRLKQGIISDYLPWLLIGIAILVIIMIAIFLLREKGIGLIDRLKEIFGGGAWLSLLSGN